ARGVAVTPSPTGSASNPASAAPAGQPTSAAIASARYGFPAAARPSSSLTSTPAVRPRSRPPAEAGRSKSAAPSWSGTGRLGPEAPSATGAPCTSDRTGTRARAVRNALRSWTMSGSGVRSTSALLLSEGVERGGDDLQHHLGGPRRQREPRRLPVGGVQCHGRPGAVRPLPGAGDVSGPHRDAL